MNTYQKGYLELNRIWMSRQEQEAHQKRLVSIKNPRFKINVHKEYNNYEEQNFYSKLRQEQSVNNRKRELYKWQDIQQKNSHMLRRLNKINTRYNGVITPPLTQSGTPRGSQKRMYVEAKHRIEVENRRLKDKLVSLQGCIQVDSLQASFSKHQKYKENIQKFLIDETNQRIKLRVDNFIDNLQYQKDKIKQKVSKNYNSFLLTGISKTVNNSIQEITNNDIMQIRKDIDPKYIKHGSNIELSVYRGGNKLRSLTCSTSPRVVHSQIKSRIMAKQSS